MKYVLAIILLVGGLIMASDKLLVAYSTFAGSTVEVAKTIADELSNQGYEVDLKLAKEVQSLAGYKGLVLGSAIRMGALHPEMKAFLDKYKTEIKSLPTAVFVVYLRPENKEQYINAFTEVIKPVSEAYFLGKMDFGKINFFEGLISRMVGSKEEDRRDFAAISAWAINLKNKFN